MEGTGNSIEFFRHDNFSDKSFLDVDKVILHHDQESIVSDKLLSEHSVEATVVISGVCLSSFINVVGFRSLGLNIGSNRGNTFVTSHTSSTSSSWLERQDGGKHIVSNLGIGGDLGVFVHTESFRLRVKRKLLDVLNVIVLTSSRNTSVVLGVREVEFISQDFRDEIATNDAEDKSSINVISDTTSIVNLSDQEIEHLEGNFFEVIKENLELFLAYTIIFIGEGVRDVPADTSELSSILDNSMEEAESKQ